MSDEGLVSASEVMRRARHRLGAETGMGPAMEPSRQLERIEAPSFLATERPSTTFEQKIEYVLADFVRFDDVEFIDHVYRALLLRDPDEHAKALLRDLRSGTIDKVEVLGQVRFSAEGMARSVHVDGLLIPYKLRELRKLPLLGKGLAWLMGWVRNSRYMDRVDSRLGMIGGSIFFLRSDLSQLAREQGARVASVERAMHERASVSDVQVMRESLQSLGNDVFTQGAAMKIAIEACASTSDVQAIQETMRKLAGDLTALGAALEHDRRVRASASDLQLVQESIRVLADEIEAQRAETERKKQAAPRASAVSGRLDQLYSDFEDKFRGSQEQVTARMLPYLKVVSDVGAGTINAPVLDIGCGRGEWLRLLRDDGRIASGVDLNGIFVEDCSKSGLSVELMDGLEKLRSLPDACLGMVSMLHVVEHLPFELLIDFLDEARRVLLPGGGLLLETPNPENSLVAQWSFYMDPTHRNPLPPELLRWLVESRGFSQSDILRLYDARPTLPIDQVAPEVPGSTTINGLVAPWLASFDYAIIARKPAGTH